MLVCFRLVDIGADALRRHFGANGNSGTQEEQREQEAKTPEGFRSDGRQ